MRKSASWESSSSEHPSSAELSNHRLSHEEKKRFPCLILCPLLFLLPPNTLRSIIILTRRALHHNFTPFCPLTHPFCILFLDQFIKMCILLNAVCIKLTSLIYLLNIAFVFIFLLLYSSTHLPRSTFFHSHRQSSRDKFAKYLFSILLIIQVMRYKTFYLRIEFIKTNVFFFHSFYNLCIFLIRILVKVMLKSIEFLWLCR